MRIVCCVPFGKTWRWFAPQLSHPQIEWHFFYAIPQNAVERTIRHPDSAIVRAAFQAVRAAQQLGASLLISHDPRVTLWCALFAELFQLRAEHVAYSFNFPDLPRGIKYQVMKRAFRSVHRFIVYSKMEKHLYSDYFAIPDERIDVCLWSVGIPKIEPDAPLDADDYICAIGGNARDYPTLIATMRELPDIKLVIVARPHNLKGLDIPPNVKVLTDIPNSQAMNILKYSRFMVLPLCGTEVPCGHVTLVAAMHLAKGFIITNSLGVSDYVIHNYNAITCEAFSAEALGNAIQTLWNDVDQCRQLGENGRRFASQFCSEESALQRLQDLLHETKDMLTV